MSDCLARVSNLRRGGCFYGGRAATDRGLPGVYLHPRLPISSLSDSRAAAASGMKLSLQGVKHASVMAAASGLVRSPWCPGSPHLRGSILNFLSRRTSAGTCFRKSPTTLSLSATDASGIAGGTGNTLLVGSQQDAASRAIISALLARGDWVETSPGIEKDGTRNGKAYTHKKSPTSLWSVKGGLLDLDDADRRWASAASGLTDEQQQREPLNLPSDVVFLSRHVAKSGVPALCVHPIGVPNVSETYRVLVAPFLCTLCYGLIQSAMYFMYILFRIRCCGCCSFFSHHVRISLTARWFSLSCPVLRRTVSCDQPLSATAAGGMAGRCPPPSPRLAGCLRELGRATREAGLESSFDVTLEVTHHGPWLETPASKFHDVCNIPYPAFFFICYVVFFTHSVIHALVHTFQTKLRRKAVEPLVSDQTTTRHRKVTWTVTLVRRWDSRSFVSLPRTSPTQCSWRSAQARSTGEGLTQRRFGRTFLQGATKDKRRRMAPLPP